MPTPSAANRSKVVPKPAEDFTLADLQYLKDPYGRTYLQLAQRFGCAVIPAHHPGISGRPMGSSFFTALADFWWEIHKKGSRVWLTVKKMKDGPSDFSVPFAVDTTQGIPVITEVSAFEMPEAKPVNLVAVKIKKFLDKRKPDWFDLKGLAAELRPEHILPPGVADAAGYVVGLISTGDLAGYAEAVGETGKVYRFHSPE
jgi:hypothetical protein